MIADEIIDEFKKYSTVGVNEEGEIDVYEKHLFWNKRRRFFPTEAHTKGEKQFVPGYLKTVLSQTGFCLERCFNLFFFAFPLARLFKIAKIRPRSLVIKMVSLSESVMQSMRGRKNMHVDCRA